jgi:hypothetical protein
MSAQTSDTWMKPKDILRSLGWDINGPWANGPGPGHSKKDRSLGVRNDPNAPHGFRVKSSQSKSPQVGHTMKGASARLS